MSDNPMRFEDRYGPWSLVLGASEGLGEAYADELASRGVNVVVAARRAALLHDVADRIHSTHGVETRAAVLDAASENVVQTLRAATDDVDVGLVIYNATSHFIGPFLDEPFDHALEQVAVNVRGLIAVCQHFARPMLARGRGGLVFMGSGAGVAGTAGLAMYSATKAFGLTLAQALHLEWRDQGVDVLGVIAPAMDTPTFRRQYNADPTSLPEPPLAPAQVAREVLDALGDEMEMMPGKAYGQGYTLLSALPRIEQARMLSARFANTLEP
jgi:short-subunit dehydrogenase